MFAYTHEFLENDREGGIMNSFLDCAVQAAREAGTLQKERYGTAFTIALKGEVDLVTEVDRASEAMIVSLLKDEFPDHNILAEENEYEHLDSPCTWIIDPLDGTTNYAHGFPWFAISIALEIGGVVTMGVIYQPLLDEMFTAVKGHGAFLNGRHIHVSDRQPLKSSLLATGFPYDRTMDNENNIGNFTRLTMASRGVRRAGAAALDLAYVAAGRLDGFWECKLKPWDVAAGALLVEEAGGRVTNYFGEEYSIHDHRIVASNGLLHDEIVGLLKIQD